MNLLEKFKAFILSNKEDILKEFEAEQKALGDILKEKTADSKKEIKTLTLGNFKIAEQKGVQGNYLVIRAVASNATVDRTSDVIIPTGVKVISGFNNRLPMLFSHDHEKIVGHWYKYGVEEDQYIVEGRIFESYNPTVYEQVKNGDLQAVSVGFYPLDYERDAMNPDITIYKEIDLFEVSLVAVGAHQQAHITDVVDPNKKTVNAVATKSVEGEGEPAEAPAKPTEDVVQTQAEPVSEVTPETDEKGKEIEELRSQLSQLRETVSQLEAEKTELEEAVSEATEVIEHLTDEKRIKYGIKG